MRVQKGDLELDLGVEDTEQSTLWDWYRPTPDDDCGCVEVWEHLSENRD